MDTLQIIVWTVIVTINLIALAINLGRMFVERKRNEGKSDDSRFIKTEEEYLIDDEEFSVVIDSKTKNLYLYNSSYFSLTPLYDENGIIAKGEIKE